MKMNILVIDDNATHRNAAIAQLKDHDLTVVGSYDEAAKLVQPNLDWDLYRSIRTSILEESGLGKDFSPYGKDVSEEDGEKYGKIDKAAEEKATTYPSFDVVLIDLLMPATKMGGTIGPDGYKFIGQEMPLGIFLAILAAKNGAKYVAVLTDTNHHAHPASAAFDAFRGSPFKIEGAKVLFSNDTSLVSDFDPEDLSKNLGYGGHDGPSVKAKDWGALLEWLLDERSQG